MAGRPARVRTVGFDFADGDYTIGGVVEGAFILQDSEGGVHAATYDPAAPNGTRIDFACANCGRFTRDAQRQGGRLIWFCADRGACGD